MKKNKILLMLALTIVCISACGVKEQETRGRFEQSEEEPAEDTDDDEDPDDIAAQTDASNRKIVAEALGIDENNESMKYIMANIRKIDAGRIQSAVTGKDRTDEEYMDIVAEDGTNFRAYLSGGCIIHAILNLDTGEWVTRSYR